eukprot:TRINITY_DN4038_c0_g1_i2.p1 TRINITY_DN4038_c0_g1~~TRINITY_DN4038_c0_g1_i2.p1  ORF type:complete len:374 (-),score=48.41 TRINITY_DN4038_c0_g1_i2:416-1537(-)
MFRSKLSTLTNCAVVLTNRSVVKVAGPHASKFLQGLITNDMNKIGTGSMYSFMLNSLGRVLFDIFVTSYKDEKSQPYYLLECHSKVKDNLYKTLKVYKLKSAVTIEDLSPSFSVLSVLGKKSESFVAENKGSILSELKTQPFSISKDPRCPEKMGLRLLLPQEHTKQFLGSLPQEMEIVPSEVYDMYRMRWGIAEGPEDLPANTQLPLNINGDYLNAVSFEKGCYIGQELTARTHHVGQVRRRFFGVCMKDPMEDQNSLSAEKEKREPNLLLPPSLLSSIDIQVPPPQSTLSFQNSDYVQVKSDTKRGTDGEFISGLLNMGIARLRIDGLNFENPSKTYLYDHLNRPMKVITPIWWNSELEKIRKGQFVTGRE